MVYSFVQVEVKGMGSVLGPYCTGESDVFYYFRGSCRLTHLFLHLGTGICFVILAAGRWRWSLLIIGLLLLVCLTVLMFCLLRVYVKSKFC